MTIYKIIIFMVITITDFNLKSMLGRYMSSQKPCVNSEITISPCANFF